MLGQGPRTARRGRLVSAGLPEGLSEPLLPAQSADPQPTLVVLVLDSGCCHHGLLCWEDSAGLELPLLGRPWSQPRCCGGKDTTSSVVRSCAETPSVHCRGPVVLRQLWVEGGPRGTCAQPDPWNLRV